MGIQGPTVRVLRTQVQPRMKKAELLLPDDVPEKEVITVFISPTYLYLKGFQK